MIGAPCDSRGLKQARRTRFSGGEARVDLPRFSPQRPLIHSCAITTLRAMAFDPMPWQPPIAGTESEHLLGALERLRATFRWKASGLEADGLTHRIPSSNLTLGGLLKHLARAEDEMFTVKVFGEQRSEPWRSVDWLATPEWDFESAATDSPDALYELWDSTIERSRRRVAEALEAGGLDFPAAIGDGVTKASLRRMICELIEEYGRHTGHADLLRERIDGRIGQ